MEVLLIEEILFEFFFVGHTLKHDESLPEFDGRKCNLRVGVTDSVHQDLQIKPPMLVGREKELWIPREDQGEALYDRETHVIC